MAIRVSAYTVEIGESQTLEVAQGEDREFRLAFKEEGTPVDMTGATSVVMTVRTRASGILVFARSYTGFYGSDASAGTPRFTITQSDTDDLSEGDYDVDVTWTDADGYKSQLLVKSTFSVLDGVGDADDDVTSPASVPVVYGLRWRDGWSTPSGGYLVNDAVQAQDGSLGVTAISTFRAIEAGVTYYPVNGSQLVATGWAYVAQHGGADTTEIVTAASPVHAYSLIKASPTYAGYYAMLGTSDSVRLMLGVAVTTGVTYGATFTAQFKSGPITTLLSDGSAVIGMGKTVEPSTTATGRVKEGTTNVVAVNIGATCAASLDAQVSAR